MTLETIENQTRVTLKKLYRIAESVIKQVYQRHQEFLEGLSDDFKNLNKYIRRMNFTTKLNAGDFKNYTKNVKSIIASLLRMHKKNLAVPTIFESLFILDDELFKYARSVPFFDFRRGNYLHQFNTYLIGLVIMEYFFKNYQKTNDELKKKAISLIGTKKYLILSRFPLFQNSFNRVFLSNLRAFHFLWMLTALFHDIGRIYDNIKEIEQVSRNLVKILHRGYPEKIINVEKWSIWMHKGRYPFEKEDLLDLFKENLSLIESEYAGESILISYITELKEKIDLFKISLELNHGSLLGLMFPELIKYIYQYTLKLDSQFSPGTEEISHDEQLHNLLCWVEAGFAIFFHQYKMDDFNWGLSWERHPLILMLKVCDKIQDFFRSTTIVGYYSGLLTKISEMKDGLEFEICFIKRSGVDFSKIKEDLQQTKAEFKKFVPIRSRDGPKFQIKVNYIFYKNDGTESSKEDLTINIVESVAN